MPLYRGTAAGACASACRARQLAAACAQLRRGQAGRRPRHRRAADLRTVPPPRRPRAPPRAGPAARPRRSRCAAATARRTSASTATGCPGRLQRVRQAPGMQLRRDQPSDLPVVLAEGHRRVRPLRPGPPAAGPLARGTGLRPVLHRRAAAPRPMRGLRPAAAAGRPARPGRRHLRRLRRATGHPRLRRLRHRGQALREGPLRPVQPAAADHGPAHRGRTASPGPADAVLEAICAARNPRSALNWLRREPGAAHARRPGRRPDRRPPTRRSMPTRGRRAAGLPAAHARRRRRPAAPRRRTRPHRAVARRHLLDVTRPRPHSGSSARYATWQVMRRLRASAQRAPGRAPTPPTPDTTSAPPRSSSPGSHAHGRALTDCTPGRRRRLAGHRAPRAGQSATSWPGPPAMDTASPDLPGPTRATGTATSHDQRWDPGRPAAAR